MPLLRALEARGLNVLAVFGPHVPAVLASGLLPPGPCDVLLAGHELQGGYADET